MITQSELIGIVSQRPENFSWFLGAGASRSAGLPTAGDIIWDLKLRHYCREENQDISRLDLKNAAVRSRIQSYMDANGFPPLWAENEYTTYFEKIFGEDRERQRRYISATLSERKAALSIGNRVLGGLLADGFCRSVFTTNFDSIVEKAVAEVGGNSLSAYHIEGGSAATEALNNEEYPVYVKLHGDFRYDSIKNLSSDLQNQNEGLSRGFLTAASRFGVIVAGYSGRDHSIMKLFKDALRAPNPFPHGLYWTGLKGRPFHPSVTELIDDALSKGVHAELVEIETYDAMMLRLWRNIDRKSAEADRKVRKAQYSEVNIALAPPGQNQPLVRMNALPIVEHPRRCLTLTLNKEFGWDEVRDIARESNRNLVLTKSDKIFCWGTKENASKAFGAALEGVQVKVLPADFQASENLHMKGFLEQALAYALVRQRPLLTRFRYGATYLIVNPHSGNPEPLKVLENITGNISGRVSGLFTSSTEANPKSEQVEWSEALRVSIDQRNGKLWLTLDPDIWIWPPRARAGAREFIAKRRKDRKNDRFDAILSAWVRILSGSESRNSIFSVSAFEAGDEVENARFRIGNRTGFTRRITQ